MVSEKSELLERIEHYCQTADFAESTFGFLAVNDGKLCSRLRGGKDVTLATAQKIRSYISQHALDDVVSVLGKSVNGQNGPAFTRPTVQSEPGGASRKYRPFRFYDNRQKYLAFINTCNEKWKIVEPR
jgi:hypothetical protein